MYTTQKYLFMRKCIDILTLEIYKQFTLPFGETRKRNIKPKDNRRIEYRQQQNLRK